MNRRIPLALGVLLTAAALSACATTQAAPAPKPTSTRSKQPAPVVTTAPSTPEPEAPAAEPTCETIISPGTVEALTGQGWTAKAEEFRIGETVLEGGLMCMWSDYDTPSDHGQMYAWAPIDESTAVTAQQHLVQEGWVRSVEEDRTYLTEDPAVALATDEDGYGMTYEFGDGWVKFADTKQSLLLIEWP